MANDNFPGFNSDDDFYDPDDELEDDLDDELDDDYDIELEDELDDDYDIYVEEELNELQDKLEAMTECAEEGLDLLMEGSLIMMEQQKQLGEAQAKIFDQDLLIGFLTKFVIPVMEDEIQKYKDEEAFQARKARNMAESLEMPNLAKWALQSGIEVIVNGVTITFYPSRSGRTVDSHSEIDRRGDITKTVSHLKGEATVEMILPLLGMVTARAVLDRTETDCVEAHFVDIVNTATFVLQIAGVERTITVETTGFISKSRSVGYSDGEEVMVTPVACSNCGLFHGKETAKYSAEISIY